MRRLIGEIVFCGLLVLFLAWVVWEARAWDLRARLFPLTVTIPMLALALVQLAVSVYRAFALARGARQQGEAAAPGVVRRGLITAAWIGGFAGTIWLLGFPVGSALAAFAYLRFAAREPWKVAVVYAAVTYACLIFGFDYGLKTTFPPGAVQSLLPG